MRILIPRMILFVVLVFSAVSAQTEFVINTWQNSAQRDPQIARTASGDYMVVWCSQNQAGVNTKGDIYFQLFDSTDQPVGTEQMMNTDAQGNQEKPALASNSTGIFVVAWQSFNQLDSAYDIKARVYSQAFSDPTTEFLVNTTIVNSQSNPDVAVSEDASWVIVWESWDQDGSDRGIYGQLYKNRFEKQGSEFLINTTTLNSQSRPAVKYFSNGNFIVVWESWRQDIPTQPGYGVYAQIFDSQGQKMGSEFQVNTYTIDYQWFADVETFDDTSFAIVWCSWEQDGSDGGIYAQLFDAIGQKQGSEILINRTTPQYQWLPRIVKTSGKRFAVVWSSWKQDGSREGIYTAFYDETGIRQSFEIRINDYTDNYQWEPDVMAKNAEELLVVWSSWNQLGSDYTIVGKKVQFSKAQGFLQPDSYLHTAGTSTSHFMVHVVDSTQLTGNTYELSFDSTGKDSLVMTIRNTSTGTIPVADYFIPDVENMFNLTSVFDGVCVEVIPEVDLALDSVHSYFVNHSGTTLSFRIGLPSFGKKLLAPVDVILVWGKIDTLSTGEYAFPLDTAINRSNGKEEIICPFMAWDLINRQPVNLLISELSGKINKKWDAGEAIVIQTPPPYQQSFTNTMAQISSTITAPNPVLPTVGDTVYVLTTRPLAANDIYTFQTIRANLVGWNSSNTLSLNRIRLEQNYPNPFNPLTTIVFEIPSIACVRIDLYDILGQKVKTLVHEVRESGRHRIVLDAAQADLPSGIYIYQIEVAGKTITRKMMLLK